MEANLFDRMLSSYQEAQVPVTVTLQNKIRVSGRIKAFDSYVIILESQKREILYRHAIASLCSALQDEQKRPASSFKPTPVRAATPNPPRYPSKTRTAHPQVSASSSASEQRINSSMKDGLLRWIQEQKAAK
jgi:RNA chaperone Hfq